MPHVRVGEGADLKSVGLKGLARSNRVCGANIGNSFDFKVKKLYITKGELICEIELKEEKMIGIISPESKKLLNIAMAEM